MRIGGFRAYDFDQETLCRFSDICRSVMEDIGRTPGACTPMNALLAERVREQLDAQFAVIASVLKIGGTYIVGVTRRSTARDSSPRATLT